jgi:hypothetical protein
MIHTLSLGHLFGESTFGAQYKLGWQANHEGALFYFISASYTDACFFAHTQAQLSFGHLNTLIGLDSLIFGRPTSNRTPVYGPNTTRCVQRLRTFNHTKFGTTLLHAHQGYCACGG